MSTDELIEHSRDLGIAVRPLARDVADALVGALLSKYRARAGYWIWEQLTPDLSWQDPDAPKLIASFRCDGPLVLLLETNNRWSALEFDSPLDVARVLEATWGFEFLLTNAGTEFFIAFNHHDYVMVGGAAAAQFSRWMPTPT